MGRLLSRACIFHKLNGNTNLENINFVLPEKVMKMIVHPNLIAHVLIPTIVI